MIKDTSDKEQLVYEAIFRLIDRGADLNTIKASDIASEAGIGKGSLYNYFSSKEEILERSVDYVVARTYESCLGMIQSCTTFQESCDTVFDIISNKLESRRMALRSLSGTLPQTCSESTAARYHKKIEEVLYEVYQKGVREGILKDAPRETIIFTFTSALFGYFYTSHALSEETARAQALQLLKSI